MTIGMFEKMINDNDQKIAELQLYNMLLKQKLVENINDIYNLQFEWSDIVSKKSGKEYNALCRWLINNLTTPEMEINKKRFVTDIIFCGLGRYGVNIEFKINNKLFALFYPIPQNVTVQNYQYAHYGRYALKSVNDSVYTVIVASYRIEDIKSGLIKFLEAE